MTVVGSSTVPMRCVRVPCVYIAGQNEQRCWVPHSTLPPNATGDRQSRRPAVSPAGPVASLPDGPARGHKNGRRNKDPYLHGEVEYEPSLGQAARNCQTAMCEMMVLPIHPTLLQRNVP